MASFLLSSRSHLSSSVSAGGRGGLLLCAISAFTRKIKLQLFAALTKQEIGFFETVKTGEALVRTHARRRATGQRGKQKRVMGQKHAPALCAGQLTSRLSEDTVLMARTVCLNANVMLRTFIGTMGTIYFMMTLSWKLTLVVLMETPVTAALQKVYSAYDQVGPARER